MKPLLRNSLMCSAIVLVHAAGIALAWLAPSPQIQAITPPSLQGRLISAVAPKPAPAAPVIAAEPSPATSVQKPQSTPVSEPPKAKPVAVAKPKPQPKPQPPKKVHKTAPPKATPKVTPQIQETPITMTETVSATVSEAVIATENKPHAPEQAAAVSAAPPAPLIAPRQEASGLGNKAPPYPRLSRRLKEQGTVVLEILILANGHVGEIRLHQSSGYTRLDEAARNAIRHWRYQPAKRGDQAIDYWYLQPFTFSLK